MPCKDFFVRLYPSSQMRDLRSCQFNSPKQHIHTHPESFGTKYSSTSWSDPFGKLLVLLGFEVMTITNILLLTSVVTSRIKKNSCQRSTLV